MSKEEVRDKEAQQIAASRMSSSVQSASLSDCWPASTAASSLDENINLGSPLAMDSSTMDSSSQGGTSLLSVSSPSSSKASLGRETNMLASSACVHHGGQSGSKSQQMNLRPVTPSQLISVCLNSRCATDLVNSVNSKRFGSKCFQRGAEQLLQ